MKGFSKEKLDLLLEDREMSQNTLSKKLGYSMGGFSLIVNGHRRMTVEMLTEIALILDCDIEDLMDY